MSYFEHYFNDAGEKTLRNYSRPVNLARFDKIDWMITESDLWPIAYYLQSIAHTPLYSRSTRFTRPIRFTRVDERFFAAGKLGRSG
jgi:hypothetical protein